MASDGEGTPSVRLQDPRDAEPQPTESTEPLGALAEIHSGQDRAELAEREEEELKVCTFFLRGKCHFGTRCRMSHSDPSLDDSGAVSPDPNDTADGERKEKHKKKKGKVYKSKKAELHERKEVNKKPRMRTADDVISRILWDSPVDSSEFIVGYVDRFLGVLERPFCDFSWDTSPYDCDYTTELALPRHRIQYFSYRGHRIWDRHTRTDRVFGSTGQSLAPPFGKEEEVEAMIPEVQVQQEEEQPPAVSGEEERATGECAPTENAHLEEEMQTAMSIRSSDSSPERGGNASREPHLEPKAACVVEEDTNGTEEGERGERPDGDEGDPVGPGATDASQNPSAPLEQGEETRGGRAPKKRPTHFVTFRANTPAILSCFQQLQEEMTAILPASAPHWQSAASLHVTLCLLVLHGAAEVAAAGEILQQFARLDRNPPVAVTFPVKMKHFNGRVLYLSPQPQLHLQQLNGGLQQAYRDEGLLHRDSYNPRYHLTLAKVQGEERERMFDGAGDLKVGKGLNFGRLPVNTLHLCAMGETKVDGFYQIECTVTLR